MSKYIYRITAFKDGEKRILAEYRGDDTGMYRFELERVEKTVETKQCCNDENMSCESKSCTCSD